MEDNEVIFIHGAERFSDYQGYARTLTFGGDYVDTKRCAHCSSHGTRSTQPAATNTNLLKYKERRRATSTT
jgi:hypothetical protein